ncbi:MAG TPA: YidC/Oxa1 family membrane protein insertase [Acidimicrobiia bacterium]|jgi:YidC/Oxa1 family membrane protein insertase
MSFLGDLFHSLQELLAFGLERFYDLIPSFGINIIMLTLTINFILFPLTLRQTRATRAFQEIQPEIKRIQKEYKDDPETMQKELMRTQREAGATPGGCLLPILVQSPIWFALFRVLRNISWIANGQLQEFDTEPILRAGTALRAAVERNDIEFLGMHLGSTMSEGISTGGWGALPYIGMLVLMVASQYFQQWHAQRGQSKKADLTQQQRQQQQTQQLITRGLPLFIGFVSWSFPAGLVLYWATSNLFRVGQQFALFAIDGRPTPPSSGPPDGGSPKNPDDGDGDNGSSAKGSKPHPVSQKKQRRRRK